MYFFDSQHVYIGIITFILGTIGYAGSIVFYNAYLPEIATEDRYDQLSAKGFAMGYIGGVLLLLINLIMVLKPSLIFNVQPYIDELMAADPTLAAADAMVKANKHFAGNASRIAFVAVGIWWLGFSLIPFYYLPKNSGGGNKLSLSGGSDQQAEGLVTSLSANQPRKVDKKDLKFWKAKRALKRTLANNSTSQTLGKGKPNGLQRKTSKRNKKANAILRKERKLKHQGIKKLLKSEKYKRYPTESIPKESLDKVNLIVQTVTKYRNHPALVNPEQTVEGDQHADSMNT